jgi:hypothetical protein
MPRRLAIWIPVLIVLTIGLILMLLPNIVKNYTVKHSKELLGRQISLEKLKVNYFTGTILLTDFKMLEADDRENFVSFDSLIIDTEPYRYVFGELVIEQFYLKGLSAQVVKMDSTFNFDDLVTFFSSSDDKAEEDSLMADPLQFKFSNIELKSAQFIFDNQTVNKITKLNDISFFIPYIGWDQEEKSTAGLRFAFKNEGYFESKVDLDPIGGDFEANITVYHLYLDAFKDYVATSANINSIEGMLNSNLAISGNINVPENSLVSGSFEVYDFLMKDTQDKKFLGSKKIALNLKSIDLENLNYEVDSLTFADPYVYFRMNGESNNFYEIFNISTDQDSLQQTNPAVDSVASAPISYSINNLIVQNGLFEVENYENVKLIQGGVNSNLVLTGNLNLPEQSLVSGSVEVLDFLMKDNLDKKFLGAKKVDVNFKTIDYFHSRYVMDSLIFTEPYVYFRMDSLSNNFFEAFNIPLEDEEVVSPDSSEPIYYEIARMIISNGKLDYADNLTGEIFNYYLSEIKLNSGKLVSTSDWFKFNSTMRLNKRGNLVAEVGFNPTNPYDIILDYTIKDFQLSDLNIYSKYYMGFPIVYGDMYYKSHTEILNNQLLSENKLIIQHAELGDKTGGLYDLPMKFALFILEDKNGVITLDIPVRGDLDDPTVSIGQIVWNTFKNLIVKVGTAPVTFLAGLVSVDPNDIKAIEYTYLDTAFTAQQKKLLEKLLELEGKKEGLKIELLYFNDVDAEKNLIAVNEAGKLFSGTTGLDPLSNEKEFVAFLKEKTGSDSLNILEASKFLIPISRLDSIQGLYGQVRKTNLENYLKGLNPNTQIQFVEYDPESPKNLGSIPLFETKYSLSDKKLEEN